MTNNNTTLEHRRLKQQWAGEEDWYQWGPYLAERAWGTVREDYSETGGAWEYFPHDQARSRAYRWNEDGMGGICDREQHLCLALALWNGQDAILKERAFGLTGNQGNRGEDVKEIYFYEDATPTHSYLKYRYYYPQQAYPYEALVTQNRNRSRSESPFNLLDTGVFQHENYWDVQVEYAKQSAKQIHLRIRAHNRGQQQSVLTIMPQLWFRNTWSWGDDMTKPQITLMQNQVPQFWSVKTSHPSMPDMYLYGRGEASLLFTENQTNEQRLWNVSNPTPFVKDAFHRYLIEGKKDAVNPANTGSKFGAAYRLQAEAGQTVSVELVLSEKPLLEPFIGADDVFNSRQAEATDFYRQLLPDTNQEDHQILRQAMAGMIWTKQFFHYDVERWLRGDLMKPKRQWSSRNRQWKHLKAADIISMPDCWEYPWFAAWDLAFHTATLSHIDIGFAKDQIELMVNERYLHPNGQLPAYEWAFGDSNPPVHAWGALKVYRGEQMLHGSGDINFLERIFHKLLLNYAWWINRKDKHGLNLFEGGFLGLDNISVYDRSKNLASGYSLKQADATGWMAMFSANMTIMALEINLHNPDYEDIAIQCYQQFLAIANTIAGADDAGISLWDYDDGFFKDLLITPSGETHRINVFSWVGLIPLFACEVIDQHLLAGAPRFRRLLRQNKGGLFRGNYICACPEWENDKGEHLLALVDHSQLPRILKRLLNESEFLSPFGIRSMSRIHANQTDLGYIPGLGETRIEYVPGESNTGLFGGNSNWRGPVWMPTNYALIQALEKYHRFLGDDFTMPVPCENDREMNLKEIASLIADRLVNLYRRNENGEIPALRNEGPFQQDEQSLYTFYEYFHAETGRGLGAAHQTGWTGLIANLVMRKYRKDIPVKNIQTGDH